MKKRKLLKHYEVSYLIFVSKDLKKTICRGLLYRVVKKKTLHVSSLLILALKKLKSEFQKHLEQKGLSSNLYKNQFRAGFRSNNITLNTR